MSHPAVVPKVDHVLLRRLANTVRGLSIDAIEKADSGHPGLPLGCADLAVTLWYHFLRYDVSDPAWPNRDRFILSAGHGSMLLYSLLHLAGYKVSLDDLKAFRQWDSITPGHPEIHLTPGVEATTGPLGQGISNAVGMALSGAMLRARFGAVAPQLIDHFVYVLASDGDLMEGVAAEAASLAGEWRLGNLIVLYDDNDITLDGPAAWSFSREDRAKRFEAYGWHVQRVDGFDHQAIANAIAAAQNDERPSLIVCKTIIGFGSPNKANSSKVHGSPLGKDELAKTKAQLGLPPEPFHVPQEDRDAWAARAASLQGYRREWDLHLASARSTNAAELAVWDELHAQALPADIAAKLPAFDPAKPVATRNASGKALAAIAPHAPWLVGGSADLSGSTKAIIPNTTKVQAGDYLGRDLYYGVREHGMGAVMNGISTQGAFRAFGGTFLTFSDYNRPTIRLAALSHIPSIFVFTHDSVFLGEDGPTHQSVEHFAALRAIPNLLVIRPGDANESSWSWVVALQERKRPTVLIYTRQDLPVMDQKSGEFASAEGLRRGAYILRREKGAAPELILIATGSELHLAVNAARQLEAEGRSVRVVSMPCMELFREQDAAYRESVLPRAVRRRLAVEVGVSQPWHEWAGHEGAMVTLDRYGASAPYEVLAEKFGFTTANVVAKAKALLG